MRALLIAAGAAAALVGLVGCGQGDEPAEGQPARNVTEATSTPELTPTPPSSKLEAPGDPVKTPPVTPTAPSPPVSVAPTSVVVPPGVQQLPAAQVDASAVPEYYDHRGLVWVFDDGRSLQMVAMATSGCGSAAARIVSETPAEVRIELYPLPQPQGGGPDDRMCTTVMSPRPVTVALDAPIDDRRVVLIG